MALAKQATGGTITYVNGEVVHTFYGSGTFVVPSAGTIDVLIVGGGGGAGNALWSYIGGGGGGGVIKKNNIAISAGSYAVTVGVFGRGYHGGMNTNPTAGGNSIFNGLTAYGGGPGGGSNYAGSVGGSGGGGGRPYGTPGTGNTQEGGGYSGGNGISYFDSEDNQAWNSGGGGGAGGPGGSATPGANGLGGIGIFDAISGVDTEYGRGGNGTNSYYGITLTANRGTGGSGSGGGSDGPSDGSSGIVIIRYKIQSLKKHQNTARIAAIYSSAISGQGW